VELFLKSLALDEELGSGIGIARVCKNLGVVYLDIREYAKGFDYLRRALALCAGVNDRDLLAGVYTGLGSGYRRMDSLDAALSCYRKALDIAEANGLQLAMARSYQNIANIHIARNEFGPAAELYRKSLAISRAEHIDYGVLLSCANLGVMYLNQKQYARAKVFFDSAMTYVHRLKTRREESIVNRYYATLYEEQRNYPASLRALKSYHKLKDSLDDVSTHAKIAELQSKFDTEKKEREIATLKSANAGQRVIIISALLLLAVMVSVAQWFRYKHRLSEQEQEREREKSVRLTAMLGDKNKELTEKALNIAHLKEKSVELAEEFSQAIHAPSERREYILKQIAGKLDSGPDNRERWNEFERKFREVHSDFYETLVSRYPTLTSVELRVLSLIKLDLTTKEMAEITRRSKRTIDSARNSIRKKLQLPPGGNLKTFVQSIR
jgi:tetratricopeptide (TPR) repeat protein